MKNLHGLLFDISTPRNVTGTECGKSGVDNDMENFAQGK